MGKKKHIAMKSVFDKLGYTPHGRFTKEEFLKKENARKEVISKQLAKEKQKQLNEIQQQIKDLQTVKARLDDSEGAIKKDIEELKTLRTSQLQKEIKGVKERYVKSIENDVKELQKKSKILTKQAEETVQENAFLDNNLKMFQKSSNEDIAEVYTVNELKDFANSLELKYKSKATKKELIELIKTA